MSDLISDAALCVCKHARSKHDDRGCKSKEVRGLDGGRETCQCQSFEIASSAEPAPPTGKFRKKPTLIEAMRFTGDNSDECRAFAPDMCDALTDLRGPYLIVKTKNGYVVAAVGDMLCRQMVNGKPDYWPCAADIFEATYEPA